MMELNKKFASLDGDKKVVALKNQFSGSEGLIAMIQAATDQSGQLQNTFDNFKNTKLDLDKAMELAKNDLNYKNEILKNKLNALEIEIGESLLPLKYKIAELKLAVIELANNLILGPGGHKQKGAAKANDKYADLIDAAPNMNKEDFVKNLAALKLDIKQTDREYNGNKSENKNVLLKYLGNPLLAFGKYGYKTMLNSENKGKSSQMQLIESQFIKAYKSGANKRQDASVVELKKRNDTTGTDSTTLGDNVDSVTGSARQVRNLTVNIEAFNKGGINTQNTNLQHMEPTQMEEWFTEMCMRVVRSVESIY